MCRRSRERISESRRWGRRSCKQLSDTVTERKNLLPNSDLRAERDCTPTYSHAVLTFLLNYSQLEETSGVHPFLTSGVSTCFNVNIDHECVRICAFLWYTLLQVAHSSNMYSSLLFTAASVVHITGEYLLRLDQLHEIRDVFQDYKNCWNSSSLRLRGICPCHRN